MQSSVAIPPAQLEEILRLICELRRAPIASRAAMHRAIDAKIRTAIAGQHTISVQEAREWIEHELLPDYWRNNENRSRPDVAR